jgi:hypothetical protein
LYRVATTVSLKSRARDARRRECEQQKTPTEPSSGLAGAVAELRAVLDEEIARLPEKYRLPLVLCYFDGLTKDEAATRLDWPTGSVSGRLARARELLRGRLERRGLALSVALLATLLSQSAASAAVPLSVVTEVVRHAALMAADPNHLTRAVSPSVAFLVQGVMRDMFLTKLKLTAGALVALGALAVGGNFAFHTAEIQAAPLPKPVDKPANPKADGKAIDFISDQAFVVSEFIDGVNPHQLGNTGPQMKAVSIPANAEWYVTPQVNQFPARRGGPIQVIRPGIAPAQPQPGANAPPPGAAAPNPAAPAIAPAPGQGGAVPAARPGVMMARPVFGKQELATVVAELKKQNIPGLCLEHCDIGDEELATLQTVPSLQTLLLRHTKVTDAGLKCLAEFPALHTLVLEGSEITDEGVAHLAKVKGLKVLHLANTKITDQAFDSLKDCAGLESILVMGAPEVTDKGIAKLARMETVKAVRFMDLAKITDAGIGSLKEMKALTTVQLEWCPEITDKGIEALKGFYHVENLRVRYLNLTADGLAFVKDVPGLKKVELLYQGAITTPNGMANNARGVPLIVQLNRSNSVYTPDEGPNAATRQKVGKLTNDVLKGLKDATALESLAIASDDLANDGLEVLGGLKGLKAIHLGGHELTGAAFKYLKGLKNLTTIDGAGLTAKEEAIAGNAKELKDLAQLEKLEVTQHMAQAEVIKTAQVLPKIKIETVARSEVDGIRLGLATAGANPGNPGNPGGGKIGIGAGPGGVIRIQPAPGVPLPAVPAPAPVQPPARAPGLAPAN